MTKRPVKKAKKTSKPRTVKQIDEAITNATNKVLGKMIDEDLTAGATIRKGKKRK